jgi:hypothetical protein
VLGARETVANVIRESSGASVFIGTDGGNVYRRQEQEEAERNRETGATDIGESFKYTDDGTRGRGLNDLYIFPQRATMAVPPSCSSRHDQVALGIYKEPPC